MDVVLNLVRKNYGSASKQAGSHEKQSSQGVVQDLKQPTPLYRITDIFDDLAHRLTTGEHKLCVGVSTASTLRTLDKDAPLRLVLFNLKYAIVSMGKNSACPGEAFHNGTEGVITQFITSDETCSISFLISFAKHLFMNPEVAAVAPFFHSLCASKTTCAASNNFEIIFSSFVPIRQLLELRDARCYDKILLGRVRDHRRPFLRVLGSYHHPEYSQFGSAEEAAFLHRTRLWVKMKHLWQMVSTTISSSLRTTEKTLRRISR